MHNLINKQMNFDFRFVPANTVVYYILFDASTNRLRLDNFGQEIEIRRLFVCVCVPLWSRWVFREITKCVWNGRTVKCTFALDVADSETIFETIRVKEQKASKDGGKTIAYCWIGRAAAMWWCCCCATLRSVAEKKSIQKAYTYYVQCRTIMISKP